MKKLLIALALLSSQAFAAQGLSGTYYHAGAYTTGIWDGFAGTESFLAGAPAATGTFTATALNYGGGDGSSILSFLGSDALSYQGAAGDMGDGVLVLKGWINLAAGTTTLSVTHDDGYRLFLDGSKLGQDGCCGTSSADVSFAAAGWHAIEVDYNNSVYGDYGGGASFALSEGESTIALSDLSTTNPLAVPEPASIGMLLAGLGLVGAVRRRSTK